jgi:hypothetical protein
MEFIDVAWRHNFEDEPVRLVSELDARRYETRKLEFFSNGKIGFASATATSERTMLGVEPVPPLSEINSDPQFSAPDLSSASFEELWAKYAQAT